MSSVMDPWFLSFALIVGSILLGLLYRDLVAQPVKLRSAMMKQGISGPTPTLLFGNLLQIRRFIKTTPTASAELRSLAPPPSGAPTEHNCSKFILPFLYQWQKNYGDLYMFFMGKSLTLHVTQYEIVREITTSTSLDLGKPEFEVKLLSPILGQGVITSNGTHWDHQRKIIAPEFYLDKVKRMIKLVQDSSLSLISSWNDIINEAEGGIADIKIDPYLRIFSGDVISKACFGSNFSKGEEIFSKLTTLQDIICNSVFGIPGLKYLPTKSNRKAWKLEKEIKPLILKVVKERNEKGYEEDLLQMILEGAKAYETKQESLDRFIVDNCKSIYLAGYETTALSATWCMMLLASNPEWQDRVRAEVLHICKGQIPNDDMIRQMKMLSMVIQEALRLYPPVPVMAREALKYMKFGDLMIPKGVVIWMSVLKLHTDPEIWGPDSYEFNPERFSNGVAGACKMPNSYMPFGIGQRVCLGQNLALMELKMMISLILANFSFTLSPAYIHAPVTRLLVEPHYGVNRLIKKFEQI